MTMDAPYLNTYRDGSGGHYAVRAHGRWLWGFNGRTPQWTHENSLREHTQFLTFTESPRGWAGCSEERDFRLAAKLVRENPCCEVVRIGFVEIKEGEG